MKHKGSLQPLRKLMVLGNPTDYIRSRYVASPEAVSVFRFVAAAEKVDLYDDFTGILVVDGIQKDRMGYSDDTIYGLLDQIRGLSPPAHTSHGNTYIYLST